MESTVLQRIREFIEFSNVSDRKFAETIGVPQTTISSLFKRGNDPNISIISAILKAYPNINMEWLISGNGNMIKLNIIEDENPIIDTGMWERFEQFINYQYPKYIKSLDLVSKELQIAEDRLNDILFDGAFLNYSELIILSDSTLNIEWLLTGKGEMLKSEAATLTSANSDKSVSYKLVPLLNLDAVGGMHKPNASVGESEYMEKLIPFTDAQKDDVALIVSGNSMEPTCPAGSKVLIREVKNWKEYFGFGNIFVILLEDGRRILKEVQKYPEDPKRYVLCKSHNDKYPEEELPKSMIKSVWKVVKILNERGW